MNGIAENLSGVGRSDRLGTVGWIRRHLEAIAGPGLVMLMLLTLLFV